MSTVPVRPEGDSWRIRDRHALRAGSEASARGVLRSGRALIAGILCAGVQAWNVKAGRTTEFLETGEMLRFRVSRSHREKCRFVLKAGIRKGDNMREFHDGEEARVIQHGVEVEVVVFCQSGDWVYVFDKANRAYQYRERDLMPVRTVQANTHEQRMSRGVGVHSER